MSEREKQAYEYVKQYYDGLLDREEFGELMIDLFAKELSGYTGHTVGA